MKNQDEVISDKIKQMINDLKEVNIYLDVVNLNVNKIKELFSLYMIKDISTN